MILTAMKLILSILIPFSAGYVSLLFLFPKRALPISLKVALSYGLGLGILAIWMLCLFIFQHTFNLLQIRTPFVLITIFIFLFYLVKRHHQPKGELAFPLQQQKKHIATFTGQYIAHNLYLDFSHLLWSEYFLCLLALNDYANCIMGCDRHNSI